MKFKNALAPTEEELIEWAKDPDSEYPEEMNQDWDLILADMEYAPILIKLASDNNPNRLFFLSCLYTLSGDSVRAQMDEDITQLREIFKLIPDNAPHNVKLWAARSEKLIADPSSYNYDDWGWGLLANKDDA